MSVKPNPRNIWMSVPGTAYDKTPPAAVARTATFIAWPMLSVRVLTSVVTVFGRSFAPLANAKPRSKRSVATAQADKTDHSLPVNLAQTQASPP